MGRTRQVVRTGWWAHGIAAFARWTPLEHEGDCRAHVIAKACGGQCTTRHPCQYRGSHAITRLGGGTFL